MSRQQLTDRNIKMFNFKNIIMNLVELNAQEVQETEGGWPRLTGFLDGIDGNLEWHWW